MNFAMKSVLGAVGLQVALGITTLLYLVPVPLAAAHQANSLVLLTTCLLLCHRVFVKPKMANTVKIATGVGRGSVVNMNGRRGYATLGLRNAGVVKTM